MRNQVQTIVAWHPVLTDHQAFTYQELANQSGLPVVVNVMRLEDEIRKAQGWTDTRVTGISRQIIPKNGFLKHITKYLISNRQQIHIFGSVFESWRMMFIVWIASMMRIEFYLISEPYSEIAFGYLEDESSPSAKIKTLLRPLFYKVYSKVLCRGISGLFAISNKAIDQYRKSGISSNNIFPFGYFIPKEPTVDKSIDLISAEEKSSLQVVFVGSLIKRKGVSDLVEGVKLAIKSNIDMRLDIYGPGDSSCLALDVDHMRYMGKIPFGKAQTYLNRYDLLILPSYYDGWGVVVNEAICANVPVLCSDRVGARVLIETFGVGQVFECGDARALAAILITLATHPQRLQAMKDACEVAAVAIQPARAAAYMLEVLSTEQSKRTSISSPWYGAYRQ